MPLSIFPLVSQYLYRALKNAMEEKERRPAKMTIDSDVQSYSRSKQGKYSPKGICKNTKTREYFRIKPTLKPDMQLVGNRN